MTVRDLIKQEIDIDVYDNVCEELGIAFCGPLVLTEEGEAKFKDVMDYELEYIPHSYGGYPAYIVHVDDPDDEVWKLRLAKAKEFFEAAAGYCADTDYQLWFKDE